MVLGSGWSHAVDFFEVRDLIPYNEIPGLGRPTVAGHEGKLIWGAFAGLQAFLFQGRRHLFEGIGWTPIALPIYLLRQFEASVVILTNAAGSLNSSLAPGQLMLIDDHINLMGASPLCGINHQAFGDRFPDLSEVYDHKLRLIMRQAARAEGEDLRSGIYCACLGPGYETPAEARMLHLLGADAVGMSTVPCAVLAKAAGLKVVGLSCLSNYAAGLHATNLSHSQIVNTAELAAERMQKLIAGFLRLAFQTEAQNNEG